VPQKYLEFFDKFEQVK